MTLPAPARAGTLARAPAAVDGFLPAILALFLRVLLPESLSSESDI
mgnify:CR=1 FL=1